MDQHSTHWAYGTLPSEAVVWLAAEVRFLRDPGIPDTRKICTKLGRMLEKCFKILDITYKKVPTTI